MTKYPFPYTSLDGAIQDKFAKIGGRDQAWTMLRTGHYNVMNRKERNARVSAAEELYRNDKEFRESVDAKTNAELGRGKKTA